MHQLRAMLQDPKNGVLLILLPSLFLSKKSYPLRSNSACLIRTGKLIVKLASFKHAALAP